MYADILSPPPDLRSISAPPSDLGMTGWFENPRLPLPFEETKRAFLGDLPVIEEADLVELHYRYMQGTHRMLQRAASSDWLRSRFELDGYVFWIRGDRFRHGDLVAAIAGQPDILVGGIHQGTTFVVPEARGRGVARAMVLCASWEQAYSMRWFLTPTSYSRGGYRTRLSAHRKAVEIALAMGEKVREEVLAEYPDLKDPAAASGSRLESLTA